MRVTCWKKYNDVPTRLAAEIRSHLTSATKTIDFEGVRTKKSKEKTKIGRMLCCPTRINAGFRAYFKPIGWLSHKRRFRYPNGGTGSYEMDFLSDGRAIEIQLGKYAFAMHDLAKFETFFRRKEIRLGVLVLPDKTLQSNMSSGVGCFDQAVHLFDEMGWNLPVIIAGFGP